MKHELKSISKLTLAAAYAVIACGTMACTTQRADASSSKSASQNTSVKNPATAQTREQKFAHWKQDFIARAIAKNYAPNMVRAVIGPAKLNPRAIKSSKNQPEFTKPIWSYVDGAANTTRIKNGRSKLAQHSAMFDLIEQRYHVDRNVLSAIWGLETAYGKIIGDHDIINSLASFAYDGRRQSFGEEQLFAILDMIQKGDVRPEQLVGSWAGAMGMTQFIPTTFRDYAVDFIGDGNKDLWTSEVDALGSAAHYFSRHGWRSHEPILAEVALPNGFNFTKTIGTNRSIRQWKALDVIPINGKTWSNQAGDLKAKLLVPAGSNGPILLTFKNFDVIKKYNNSTSYALGITALSKAFSGETLLTKDWPRTDKQLSRTQKKAMQRALTAQGFNTNGIDGRIGPNTRKAIRAWQAKHGIVVDGYVEQKLLKRILTAKVSR